MYRYGKMWRARRVCKIIVLSIFSFEQSRDPRYHIWCACLPYTKAGPFCRRCRIHQTTLWFQPRELFCPRGPKVAIDGPAIEVSIKAGWLRILLYIIFKCARSIKARRLYVVFAWCFLHNFNRPTALIAPQVPKSLDKYEEGMSLNSPSFFAMLS